MENQLRWFLETCMAECGWSVQHLSEQIHVHYKNSWKSLYFNILLIFHTRAKKFEQNPLQSMLLVISISPHKYLQNFVFFSRWFDHSFEVMNCGVFEISIMYCVWNWYLVVCLELIFWSMCPEYWFVYLFGCETKMLTFCAEKPKRIKRRYRVVITDKRLPHYYPLNFNLFSCW